MAEDCPSLLAPRSSDLGDVACACAESKKWIAIAVSLMLPRLDWPSGVALPCVYSEDDRIRRMKAKNGGAMPAHSAEMKIGTLCWWHKSKEGSCSPAR